METPTSRREFLALAAAIGASAPCSRIALAQALMPTRTIPSTGEHVPVIGLGSSKVVSEITEHGTASLEAVLRTLIGHGGRLVDTWPRNAQNDTGFGRVINLPDLRDALFITTKIDRVGKEAGIAQFEATRQHYGRETLDLAQIFSLTDLDVHWPSLLEWKASGKARYIGVTVAEAGLYDTLESFLGRESPDFIQINYSITERLSEQRIIPMARDMGIGIIINRPFMNGTYFERLEAQSVPDWAAEFDCETWAQFSLKYILANPALTCVLTETSNPVHMEENALAAIGRVPDAAALARMREFIDTV